MSIECAPELFISHHLLEEPFCSFLITSTELCGLLPPRQLSHPLANKPRAISKANSARIEGCKKLDRLAVYECYFSQIKSHRVCLFRKKVVDYVYVHFLKMAAYEKLNQTVAVDQSNDFACHPLAFPASIE
jgi:hypothetical protein